MSQTQEDDRYPLWCIDRGKELGESQYLGPYQSRSEAEAAMRDRALATGEYVGGRPRRCRRLRLSEIDGAQNVVGSRLEMALEDIDEGPVPEPPGAWGCFDDQIVVGDIDDKVEKAVMSTLDAVVTVNAYVCEGDE